MENYPTNVRFLPFSALRGYRKSTVAKSVDNKSRLVDFRTISYQSLVVFHNCEKGMNGTYSTYL